jgi:hypothetical protein
MTRLQMSVYSRTQHGHDQQRVNCLSMHDLIQCSYRSPVIGDFIQWCHSLLMDDLTRDDISEIDGLMQYFL